MSARRPGGGKTLELVRPARARKVVVTGGAGFVGANLAHRLLEAGRSVLLFDNLARPSVERNATWLRAQHGEAVQIQVADIRDRLALEEALTQAEEVYHFAAQVAVTTSLDAPRADFEVNAQGTLNVLEALRALPAPPPLVYTSTNKVYGALPHIELQVRGERCRPRDAYVREHGIGETQPLSFYTPYGCSKGTADQYVLDYARTYGIPAVVFRMSCVYGPRQFGTCDQGWVAHFLRQAIRGEELAIFGDGTQVRDLLHVDDLVDAFLRVQRRMKNVSGCAFNIGGGPANTVSLLELLDLIEELCGEAPRVSFHDWRPGDQRYYVSDIRRFQAATGWEPRVAAKDGIERLFRWLSETEGKAASPRDGRARKRGT